MESIEFGKIQKASKRHAAAVSKQTGFPSPATHYLEPSIDLNEVLTTTKDATFFVRVTSDDWSEYLVLSNDILIVDRALKPRYGAMALVIEEGNFTILRIPDKKAATQFTVWGVITYIIHSVL